MSALPFFALLSLADNGALQASGLPDPVGYAHSSAELERAIFATPAGGTTPLSDAVAVAQVEFAGRRARQEGSHGP